MGLKLGFLHFAKTAVYLENGTISFDKLKQCLLYPTNEIHSEFKSIYFRVFGAIIGDGLVLLEGAGHATHKRLMGPSFNNASVRSKYTIKVSNIQVD